jgi:hypothetical protein
MWKYVIAGAVLGALLGVIGVLLFGACLLSPGGLLFLLALDSNLQIYLIGGIVVGALIGAVVGYGFSDGRY